MPCRFGFVEGEGWETTWFWSLLAFRISCVFDQAASVPSCRLLSEPELEPSPGTHLCGAASALSISSSWPRGRAPGAGLPRHAFAHECVPRACPPAPGAVRADISAPLRCFTISAQMSSSLLLPAPVGPKILRGEVLYNEKGLGEPWACSCPAVLLGGSADAPETPALLPAGWLLCCPATGCSLSAPRQAPAKS